MVPACICGVMLCLVQWFAWTNFRSHRVPVPRLLGQLTVVFLALFLVTLAFALVEFLVRTGGRH
jgi:hypothetical protein